MPRSFSIYWRTLGAVPKRPKGEVCKTSIRGFESHPRLHNSRPLTRTSIFSPTYPHPFRKFTSVVPRTPRGRFRVEKLHALHAPEFNAPFAQSGLNAPAQFA